MLFRSRAAARAAQRIAPEPAGLLAGVPAAMPGLTRAVKLQRQAAKAGFDWDDARLVLEKIREEAEECEAAIGSGTPDEIAGEIGDLRFAVANLARHADVDPEAALRKANAKFIRRFGHVEASLGPRLAEASLDEMEALWVEAKGMEGVKG